MKEMTYATLACMPSWVVLCYDDRCRESAGRFTALASGIPGRDLHLCVPLAHVIFRGDKMTPCHRTERFATSKEGHLIHSRFKVVSQFHPRELHDDSRQPGRV